MQFCRVLCISGLETRHFFDQNNFLVQLIVTSLLFACLLSRNIEIYNSINKDIHNSINKEDQ